MGTCRLSRDASNPARITVLVFTVGARIHRTSAVHSARAGGSHRRAAGDLKVRLSTGLQCKSHEARPLPEFVFERSFKPSVL